MKKEKTAVTRRALVAGAVAATAFAVAPKRAYATIEGDQSPATEEEIQEALTTGEIGPQADEPTLMAASSTSSFVDAYSGDTRFDTAAMQARSAYSSSEYVIVVGDGGWPDALSATGLAGVLDCPILLTERGGLSEQAASAIRDLGASRAVVLGGDLVVSGQVVSDLEGMGLKVDHLAGETRQDTQLLVYEYGLKAPNGGTWSTDTVAFASGARFHDALSFSPVAFADRVPIFLADASGNLSAAQREALSGRRFATSVVLGGPIVTSDATVAFAGSVSSSGQATRLAGDTRYDTSALVAEWSVKSRGFTWDGCAFTTASLPYDALAGSVLQGRERSVILLVDSGSSSTVAKAAANRGSITRIKFFGGTLSISNGARMAIVRALGQKYSCLPGFKDYVDAGHGQNDSNNGAFDPGACANGYREADLTAELARNIGNILWDRYGISSYVNDGGGWYKLRQADAEARGCTYIVSIHFNAGGGNGSESLIHDINAAESSAELQDAIHPYLIKGMGLKDRGQKTQRVAILGGNLPATLLEICFIDSSDIRTYQSRKGTVAEQIAAGIANA